MVKGRGEWTRCELSPCQRPMVHLQEARFCPLFPPWSYSSKPFSLYNVTLHSQLRERAVKSRAALISWGQDKRCLQEKGRWHPKAWEQVCCLKAQRGCCQGTENERQKQFWGFSQTDEWEQLSPGCLESQQPVLSIFTAARSPAAKE